MNTVTLVVMNIAQVAVLMDGDGGDTSVLPFALHGRTNRLNARIQDILTEAGLINCSEPKLVGVYDADPTGMDIVYRVRTNSRQHGPAIRWEHVNATTLDATDRRYLQDALEQERP